MRTGKAWALFEARPARCECLNLVGLKMWGMETDASGLLQATSFPFSLLLNVPKPRWDRLQCMGNDISCFWF